MSTLVSYSAMVTSGRFCIVQTLSRKVPVLMMSDSQNGNMFILYVPLSESPLQLSWFELSV